MITSNMLQKKNVIHKHLEEQKNNRNHTVAMLLILNEIFDISKDQFYRVFIAPKLYKYPIISQIASKLLNDEVLTETQTIDRKHLTEIILETFSVVLLQPQLTSTRPEFAAFAAKTMENVVLSKIAQYTNIIWMDSIEVKSDDIASSLIKVEAESCNNLTSIISNLCANLGVSDLIKMTNFSSIVFINLLQLKKQKFTEIKQIISDRLKIYLDNLNKAWSSKDTVNKQTGMHCDEHKEHTADCIKCISTLDQFYLSSWITENSNVSLKNKQNILVRLWNNIKNATDGDQTAREYLVQNAIIIYKHVFDIDKDLKKYSVSVNRDNMIKTSVDKAIEQNLFISTDNNSSRISKILMFYSLIFAELIPQIYQFHPQMLQKSLNQYDTLQQIFQDTDQWLKDKVMPELKIINIPHQNVSSVLNIIQKMFSVDLHAQLPLNQMKTQFIQHMLQIMKNKFYLNKVKHVETQAAIKSRPYIEKTKSIIKVPSVKRMKSSWYQGINETHGIQANKPITQSHVLALVLYTHCTELCAKFRETYRKISHHESMKSQIDRHAEFANLG
eukprot:26624_1